MDFGYKKGIGHQPSKIKVFLGQPRALFLQNSINLYISFVVYLGGLPPPRCGCPPARKQSFVVYLGGLRPPRCGRPPAVEQSFVVYPATPSRCGGFRGHLVFVLVGGGYGNAPPLALRFYFPVKKRCGAFLLPRSARFCSFWGRAMETPALSHHDFFIVLRRRQPPQSQNSLPQNPSLLTLGGLEKTA